MNPIQILASGAALVMGAWSALQYWRQGHKLSVLLVINFVVAIGALLWWDQVSMQLHATEKTLWKSSALQTSVDWDSDQQSYLSPTMLKQLEHRAAIVMQGDGLRASQWRDVPARRLVWQVPQGRERIQLQAPSEVTLGREFELILQRPQLSSSAAKKTWSVQLLAENGQLLAQQSTIEPQLTLRWLPPIAERMELQLKVLDHGGRIIDRGPIPIEVKLHRPLHVSARFGSASFDISSLRQLLQTSEANLDWQTRMGQTVQHHLQARDGMAQANVMLVDAAYWENTSAQMRQQILQKIGQGTSLLILGANARQPQIWRESMGLELGPTASKASNQAGTPEVVFEWTQASLGMETKRLVMSATAMQAKPNSTWSSLRLPEVVRDDGDFIFGRTWKQGRIVWIGVSDWHRYLISAPETLKQWWQALLDQSLILAPSETQLRVRETMPIVGERISLCLDVETDNSTEVSALRDSAQTTYAFAASLDDVGQKCVNWRANASGWQSFTLLKNSRNNARSESKESAQTHQHGSGSELPEERRWVYVYPNEAWPTWQRELKRDATIAYQNRIAGVPTSAPQEIPHWPLLVWIMVLSLLLWFFDMRRT